MLPVDARWDEREGWHFLTPWPMTDKAMANTYVKARAFYLGLWNDLPEGPAREQIERALRDLEDRKVRNVVGTKEAPPVILTPQEI